MNGITKWLSILSIIFFCSSQAIASSNYFNNSSEKLVSGVSNAVTGWVELPKNIILTSQIEGPLYGITVGTVMGIMHTVGRSLVGVLDAATFFIPTRPSVTPPFIWQDFSRETSY